MTGHKGLRQILNVLLRTGPIAFAILGNDSAHAASDWQFSFSGATARSLRGLDLGAPSLSAAAEWYPVGGPFAAVSVTEARIEHRGPVGTLTIGTFGYDWRQGAWRADLMLEHYQFTHVAYAKPAYDEAQAVASWRDLVSLSVGVSPNTQFGPSPKGYTFEYNLVGRLPISYSAWTLHAGIGYFDARTQLGIGYGYGNVGVSYQYRSAQFDLSYVGSSHGIQARLPDLAVNRLEAAAVLRF
ncbi:hypothetical protein FAZ69_00900 [Trinickia terrae]|uniref:Porin family protein n=1 Tax=Trinickia terrae TaxID=2571161 RepID=A0A4U1IF39_9BURK|nr:hypothetical protein [Trinickia terrae]TKC92282.1 hypothetical protein FAZ69_00900 [Trinickia terrae]